MYPVAVIMIWTNNNGSKRAEQDKKLIAMIRTICKEGLNTLWYCVLTFKSSIKNEKISFSQKFVLFLILLPIILPSEFYY